MSLIPDKRFKKSEYLTNSRFTTWSHGGHIGVHNKSEKVFLGILFYYSANLERHFAIDLYTNIAVSSREFNLQLS